MNGQEWVERYRRDAFGDGQGGHGYEYASSPKVTLSASIESGRRESSIPVLNQRSYTGRKPVISSSLADTPCTSLGVKGLLRKLNAILSTSYMVETCPLSTFLEDYIGKGYDFGTVYGRLCPFCNRAVPWWVARQYPWAISHAWMDEKDRKDVHTPINECEWPMLMPRDADLDLIHIEMLNNGAEYVWLDVLCLRQKDKWQEEQREEQRVEWHDQHAERCDRCVEDWHAEQREEREDRRAEWAVDVSTIGRVYEMARKKQLVCYLSGLGRPFALKMDDLQSDRCWFRQVWTLQEVNKAVIIGGDTGDRFVEKGMRARVDEELSSLEESINAGDNDDDDDDDMGMPVFIALLEMRRRVSVDAVDKVSGLAYLLQTHEIPPYSVAESLEGAWTALVDELNMTYRGHLFFLYPKRGKNKLWRPSWRQAMEGTLLPPRLSDRDSGWSGNVRSPEERGVDCCDGPCINSGSDPYDSDGTFQERQFWVVGERLLGLKFKKVSVFQIPNKKDVKRLHKLGVTTNTKTFLA
ncbi:hypothetical protein EV421DRAFT_1928099 [Armillaria borealis]|uniref:Heterokaryon incompatibility domain-containing protein n=1 Tax=Armillaria borealis TaxID=47425 RepID=A0AA39IYR4_9AGAR|nr:hypothetical protein EV421DRAFT_1928099 [Armillaria borealis]